VELVALRRLLTQRLGLLMEQLQCVVLGNLLALSSRCVVPCPLPQLTPRDLGSRGVLHEVVDGHTSDTTDPCLHIAQTNIEVLADTVLGDLARHVHVEQVVRSDVDILAAHMHLVGSGHVLVEDLGCDGGERWVSHPGTVVAGTYLAKLVGANLCHSSIVCLLVVLDGNLSSHTTHGVDASLVAGLDQELDVCVHEGACHGDRVSVGQDEVGVLAETLNGAEDVIPATAVETSRVVAELVDDLKLR
jgi:hypothetical protein